MLDFQDGEVEFTGSHSLLYKFGRWLGVADQPAFHSLNHSQNFGRPTVNGVVGS